MPERRYKWELLGLLCLAFFFHQGDRAIYGVVATEIQADLQLSKSEIGLVGAILFWTIALMTPIAGYLGDVLRKRIMITGALRFWSSTTALTGLSTGFFSLNNVKLLGSLVILLLCLPSAGQCAPAEQAAPAATEPKHPRFDAAQALDSAVATPDAGIQRHGSTVRVRVAKSGGRPGVDFRAPSGGWDMTGFGHVEARVKNAGSRTLNVHLALDNPGADRTERKGCVIQSATLSPGQEQTLKVAITSQPPALLEMAFRGMRAAPGGISSQQSGTIDPANVVRISVYVYHPGADYEYEVSDLRAGGVPAFPLPEKLDELLPMIDRFGQYMHKDWPGELDKPVVIGEFHFGALDRGKFHASLRPVADQQARGAAYEKYVRSALENPSIVGTHWHQYGDQATTGRDDGENFQNGLVDVCDTPYAETIEACRRIGYESYEVRAR